MTRAIVALILLWCFAAVGASLLAKPTPLLIQSALPTNGHEADANLLVSPCPLTPKNLPRRGKETA